MLFSLPCPPPPPNNSNNNNNIVMVDMAILLSPRQLGYGVKGGGGGGVGGAEAAVHAARNYLKDLPDKHALVKLDFSNPFNSSS